jgi:hypothetical protein
MMGLAPFSQAQGLSESQASVNPRWLRLYQYKQSGSQYKSDMNSQEFFFSKEGRNNPLLELKAAVQAFSDDTKKWGTLKLPARCAFPARREVLESLLNTKFKSGPCPELNEWLDRIKATQVSMVFVGAYSGNAASILGHTFLRLSNTDRENSGREGMDLLSHSVGYTAHADPGDGRLSYMVKGLTGAYPGFYDIEPYYMKVGIYNNSESRDLWDVRLNFSKKEVHFLAQVIWEHTFNAQSEYYFIGKNCSYRILTLLEAVRPELNVSDAFSFAVLPAETVRILVEAGVTTDDLRFRSSIQRRLLIKKNLLSSELQSEYQRAIRSVDAAKKINDATLADALLDYWLYENYKVQTDLPAAKQAIMTATYARAAELKGNTRYALTNRDIQEQEKLSPPFMGHKPSWVEVDGGTYKDKGTFGLGMRSGVHPRWSADPAYKDISSIEYLGFDYRYNDETQDRWNILLVKAQNLEEFLKNERKASWGFDIQISNDCELCDSYRPALRASGSYGLSTRQGGWLFAVLPDVKGALWSNSGRQGLIAPGARALVRFDSGAWVFLAEGSSSFWRDDWSSDFDVRAGYSTDKNAQIFLRFQESTAIAGYAHFY